MAPPKWKLRYLRLVRKTHRLLRHKRLRKSPRWTAILRRLLDRRLWHPCRDTVAGGLAIGLFFSQMFIPGQTIAAALIAARAKVNIPFAVAACFITNPITTPIIRPAQMALGNWLRNTMGIPMPSLGELDFYFDNRLIQLNVSDFILGFVVCGIILALISYPLVHLFSALLPHHLPKLSKHQHRLRDGKPVQPDITHQ